MKKSTAAQVKTSIDRLPRQSSVSIRQVLVNARRLDIEPLAQACEIELQARGTLNLSAADAEETAKISARVAGKELTEVIGIAFTEVPPRPEELVILQWIAQHPGSSSVQISAVYRKRDLALVIGHLVYNRFGYFKPLLTGPIQSDLLLTRDSTTGKVCYTLRAEAAAAFAALGIFEEVPAHS